MATSNPLRRSRRHRMIAGVCGGIAEWLGWLLSSPGRLSRLTIVQTSILAGAISVGLELVQLLPRPGILNTVRYTFDVLDAVATLAAVGVSSVIAKVVLGERGHGKKTSRQ